MGLNNGGELLNIKIYKNTKAFVYGYKTSCCDCMTKYTLYFKYKGIPLKLGGVLKIRREFAREQLCEIFLYLSIFYIKLGEF